MLLELIKILNKANTLREIYLALDEGAEEDEETGCSGGGEACQMCWLGDSLARYDITLTEAFKKAFKSSRIAAEWPLPTKRLLTDIGMTLMHCAWSDVQRFIEEYLAEEAQAAAY